MSDYKTFRYRQLSALPPKYLSPDDAEKRLDAILQGWLMRGERPNKTKDVYKDAFLEALKAFLKTKTGERLKEILIGKELVPVTTAMLDHSLQSAFLLQEEVPEKISVHVEIYGSGSTFQGVFIGFSAPLGSGPKQKVTSFTDRVQDLPRHHAEEIDRAIPKLALSRWVVHQAEWEYEIAGPEEEAEKKWLRDFVRQLDRTDPIDLQLLSKLVARQLLAAAKAKQAKVTITLGYDNIWQKITDRSGLVKCMQAVLHTLVQILGKEIEPVKNVDFTFQKGDTLGHIPLVVPKFVPPKVQPPKFENPFKQDKSPLEVEPPDGSSSLRA